MTIEELIIYGKKYISSNKCKALLGNITGYDPLELLIHLDEIQTEDIANKYKELVDKVYNNEPIQYIIGHTCFYGLDFIVNESVLIPRFETEELVERTIDFIEENFTNKNLKVIDLGCGSGAIGITLKKEIETLDVTCLDISEPALEVTRINANRLNANINIVHGDMLNNINEKFDVIISNPPYIRIDEEVGEEVKKEPSLALYAGTDGLDFYREILKNAKTHLKDKYLIALEIGRTQREEITKIIKKYMEDSTIYCYKDLQDNDRIILITNI